MEASWNLFWASWGLGKYLISIIRQPTGSPKKHPGSPQKLLGSPKEAKKLSGQKSLQYFCCFFGWNNDTKRHFEINWPLVLSILLQWPKGKKVEPLFDPWITEQSNNRTYAWDGISETVSICAKKHHWSTPAKNHQCNERPHKKI